MAASKPVTLPEWNSGGANNIEPSSGEKIAGWANGQVPPSATFNWWQKLVYSWVLWLNDFEIVAHTWLLIQTWQGKNNFFNPSANLSNGDSTVIIDAQGVSATANALRVTSNTASPTVTVKQNKGGVAAATFESNGSSYVAIFSNTGTAAGANGVTAVSAGSGGAGGRFDTGDDANAAALYARSAHATNGALLEKVAGTDSDKAAAYAKSTGYAVIAETTSTVRAPLRVIGTANAPSAPQNGDVYYDTTTNKLRVRAGGAWVDLH